MSAFTRNLLAALAVSLAVAACADDSAPTPPAGEASPAETAQAAPGPAVGTPAVEAAAAEAPVADAPVGEAPADTPAAGKPASGVASFDVVQASSGAFLIDAPLEKIRGKWNRFGGGLQVDLADPNKTRGEVTMDLSTLKTHTFGNPGKDARQTGHALNWMEIGPDVTPELRSKYAIARFSIESISGATAATGTQQVTAKGKLTLHGITLPQTVKLAVTFEGPAGAPTAVRIRTAAPMVVSLKGHDVKPRDLAGRFIAGALERVGEKVTDSSQVTLDIRATRAGS
jgi:polyisoprenoid-binding protein YceI